MPALIFQFQYQSPFTGVLQLSMNRPVPPRPKRRVWSFLHYPLFFLLLVFFCIGLAAAAEVPALGILQSSTLTVPIMPETDLKVILPAAVSPLPSSSPLATLTTEITNTQPPRATKTPTRATKTPTRATKTPTSEPTDTPTITVFSTEMPTPIPIPSSRFVAGELQSTASCERTVIQGTIHDGIATLDNVWVRVWNLEGAIDNSLKYQSGTEKPGRYEIEMADQPVEGWWLVAVIDERGAPISDELIIQTTEEGCEDGSGQQALTLDFWRREGPLGLAAATLTPIPPIISTLPPTPSPIPSPVVTLSPPSAEDLERVLQVPILMYHYISVPPPDSDRYRHDLSVGPDLFRAHLITLREQGYTSIYLSDLYRALAEGTPLPEKPIVLTFDDGYRDHYTNAFPIMREEGFVGTFFIITDLVEEWNINYLTWEHILEMQAAGMEFGSHTKSHADLPGKSYEAIWDELAGSRVVLETRLNQEVRTFCYPFGHFDPGVAHLAHEAGYQIAVTTKQGVSHSLENIITLRRVRVRGGMFPPTLMEVIKYFMN